MNSERWISLRRNMRARLTALVCVLFLILGQARSVYAEQESANVYHRHENGEMKIALTFDDGPHPILTPKILDILERYQVKATFFLVGENVKNYPNVVERILREGHELGNHTYTHDRIDLDEIEACEKAIYELTDYKTKLFRPPEGFINRSIKSASSALGYDIILWSIDTRDWAHTPPALICEKVINAISSGSIILMHDYISYNSPTPEALEELIPLVLNLGYRFVPVSELIGTK